MWYLSKLLGLPNKEFSPLLSSMSSHVLKIMPMPFLSFFSRHIQSLAYRSSYFCDVPRIHKNSPSPERLRCSSKLQFLERRHYRKISISRKYNRESSKGHISKMNNMIINRWRRMSNQKRESSSNFLTK